jgi:hypothetical protein
MPGDAPPLWLCGHFAAKAFAVMLDDMQIQQHRDKQLLFWQVKPTAPGAPLPDQRCCHSGGRLARTAASPAACCVRSM